MKANILFMLLVYSTAFGQNYGFQRGSKNNDYQMVRSRGITFAAGITHQLCPKDNPTFELTSQNGQRGSYTINPNGKIGGFAEFGYVIFPTFKGLIQIKKLHKTRLLDYMDMALGYRHYRGAEVTNLAYTNALGEISSQAEGMGQFSNGYLFGRFDAHTLLYVGKKKIDKARKHFIDQSLGINIDYRLITSAQAYEPQSEIQNLQPMAFHSPLVAQLHYTLGFGIRFNRAWMMVPGISIPLVGIYEWNGFNARMNWFSSTYWPVQAQLKFIKLFERTPKCGAYGDAEDMQRNKDFNDKN